MEEKTLTLATVNFLMDGDSVWLAKKAKKIGAGRLNGPGGGQEPEDENNLIATSIQETKQEFGIETSPEQFEKVAIIYFHNKKSDGSTFICEVHFFMVRGWSGTPRETETKEMLDPKPFPKNNLPISELMPADQEFVPLLMQGKKLVATYYYGPFQKELIGERSLMIVNSLPD